MLVSDQWRRPLVNCRIRLGGKVVQTKKVRLMSHQLKLKNATLCSTVVAVMFLVTPIEASSATAVNGCGVVGAPGAILVDYRVAISGANSGAKTMLKTIEDAHFDSYVETLRGQARGVVGPPGGDIGYTLERIPNHARALMAMVKLGAREKTQRPSGTKYDLECWFRRATAFVPDDNTVRLIYAQYLYKEVREKEAEYQLSVASGQAADNAFTLNNIGLVYFDANNFAQALLHAHKAYALGFSIPILKDQLKSVGKWFEPPDGPITNPPKTP